LWEDDRVEFGPDACPEELPDFSAHHSLACKVLRDKPEIYHSLKGETTPLGVSLAGCVKTGVDNPGHPYIETVGMVAGDAYCYDVFRDLFDEVIAALHPKWGASGGRHVSDLSGEKVAQTRMDASGEHIKGVRVRAARNFKALRMPALCSREERMEAERLLTRGLLRLGDDFRGLYYPLRGSSSYAPRPGGMTLEEEARLAVEDRVPEEPDSEMLTSAGYARHWPEARGCFAAEDRRLSATVNVEDHLLLEVALPGQDLAGAFDVLCRALGRLEAELLASCHGFAHSERLGYLGSSLANLGSCLTLGVTAALPKLAARKHDMDALCGRLGVQANLLLSRGHQKFTFAQGVFELTNVDRLGSTEVDQVNLVIASCRVLVDIEERLASGVAVDFGREPEASARVAAVNGVVLREAELHAEASLGLGLQHAGSGAASAAGASSLAATLLPPELAVQGSMTPLPTMATKASSENDFGISEFDRPGLDADEVIGFPADVCPEDMPSLEGYHSLLADVLRANPSIYSELRRKRTVKGVSFAKCVKAGFDSCGHPMIKTVGMSAGDAESYDVFSPLFEAAVHAAHGDLFTKALHDRGEERARLKDVSWELPASHVLSLRIRARRNLAGLRFPPAISADERMEAEQLLLRGLQELTGELEGEYIPLLGMCAEEEHLLEGADLLFYAPDAVPTLSSGVGRDWPHSRGVFLSRTKKFGAWLNEEDHLCLWSMEAGADLRAALYRLLGAEDALRAALQQEGHNFAWSPHFGNLTSCPGSVGTGLRFEARTRLPLLGARSAEFRKLCRGLHLQPKNAGLGQPDVWEVSNSRRFTCSIAEQVQSFTAGLSTLVDVESRLARGEAVDF